MRLEGEEKKDQREEGGVGEVGPDQREARRRDGGQAARMSCGEASQSRGRGMCGEVFTGERRVRRGKG
jgi:hypothetical protein